MIGGVAGRHMSVKQRRGSQPMIRFGNLSNMSLEHPGSGLDGVNMPPSRRRRAAVTTSDHKSCALIQTRLKLGDIM